ncbi:MAG: thiosulfate sulfurtransferase [Alphaproteobacteria bacterium]|nr:thiosulfate sulfurtransferase [Alphaproteobacteria bacterium]
MTQTISPSQLKNMLSDGEELALIDVREQGVFGQGHLLLASCLPLSHLEMRIADLVPWMRTRVVLLDGGDGEALTETAGERLTRWGYGNVALLAGGLAAWRDAGYEVFSGVNVPSKAFGEYVEHAYDTPRLTAGELKSRRDAGEDIVVLDSRPFAEFHRMSIPGGIDAPGAELVYRAHDMAPAPDTPIVVNCAGRTRSIIGAQSLINAGFPNPIAALENGTMGWHLAGFNVARGATAVAALPSTAGLEHARTAATRVAERFGVERVSAETLAEWRHDGDAYSLFLLDVRSPGEFALGHLPGSRNAPGGQLVQGTDEFIAVRHARIVLIDDTEVRAVMTASWLIQMGWHDVHVLAGGLNDLDLTSEPHTPLIYGEPWPNLIEPADLNTVLDDGSVSVIDLDTSLIYRDGHIPGARWAVRSRLQTQIDDLPASQTIVVTSGDGRLAALAAGEIAVLRPDSAVLVLKGGTQAWKTQGLALETGLTHPLGPNDDVQYKPYDREGGVEAAMQDYLQWEVALVEQIARDGNLTFRRYD